MAIQPIWEDVPFEGWDPTIGAMLGPAWLAACEYLRDGQWYRAYDMYCVMAEASDLPVERVCRRLHGGVKHGFLERRKMAGQTVVRVTDHGRKTRPELRR